MSTSNDNAGGPLFIPRSDTFNNSGMASKGQGGPGPGERGGGRRPIGLGVVKASIACASNQISQIPAFDFQVQAPRQPPSDKRYPSLAPAGFGAAHERQDAAVGNFTSGV